MGYIPRSQLVKEIAEEQDTEIESVEEDIDGLIEKDLMDSKQKGNKELLNLTQKFVYLKTELGMSIEEIVESSSDFQPEKVDDKVMRAKEILEQDDISDDEKNEVIEIFSDPYVRALTEDKLGGGFEINFE